MAGEIFISYRRADRAWAHLLHSQLKAEGIDAWYDAQVGAGEDWRMATAKALEASQIFVLLFSEEAAQSSDIAKELAAAVLKKKLIIPVRLQNIAPTGAFLYELASRNWVNAYEDTETRLAELAKGLARLVRTATRDESILPFERAESEKRSLIQNRAKIAAVAILVIVTSAIATWFMWPERKWTVESSRPFISTLALEGEPAFSPDGKVIAYTSGPDPLSRQIYVRNVASGDGIRVSSDTYSDVSPTWSTDGTRIAYVATRAGEPCRIMVTSVPAGEAREVGRCKYAESTSVSWQPGTSFLYYFDQGDQITQGRLETDIIMRLDLESGALMALPKKPANPILGMRHLQCSPNGKLLLLVGRENALTDALLVHDLASGEERTLGKIIISGSAAWSEDSRTVLIAESSGIGSEISAHPVDGGAPYHVYSAAINVSHLATGAGGLLALETDPSRQNLARASATPAAQPEIIDPANGRSWAPTFAPDGTLAFLSNRSGTNAIWVMRPGTAPTMLYDAGLSPMFRLEYSPDGAWLAAPVAGDDGVTVNILTARGGKVTSFHSPTLGGGAPTWTSDSREVIIFDKDVPAYVGVDIADTAHRRPVVPSPWGAVIFHNNATFAARFDKAGYWQFGKTPKLVTGKYPVRWDPPPELRGDDLLIPQFDALNGPRILAQPLAGGPDRLLAYAPGAQAQAEGLMSKMAVNPKTGEIIYVAAVQSDTNIDLLTLARR